MKKLTMPEIVRTIAKNGGKIFSVTFTKKDGSQREMVCRIGVDKGLNGHGGRYDPAQHDLLPVFDMQKQAHRMLPLNRIINIKVKGSEYAAA